MKRSLAVAVGALILLAAGMPWVQHSLAQAPNTTEVVSPSGSAADLNTQMDTHIETMRALHEKLMDATTPEARRIIMDRQREEMHGCMTTMSQMKQGGGMMEDMSGRRLEQKGGPADATPQMQMMQKRMGMMEMMMQTIMDQQGATTTFRSGDATPRR